MDSCHRWILPSGRVGRPGVSTQALGLARENVGAARCAARAHRTNAPRKVRGTKAGWLRDAQIVASTKHTRPTCSLEPFLGADHTNICTNSVFVLSDVTICYNQFTMPVLQQRVLPTVALLFLNSLPLVSFSCASDETRGDCRPNQSTISPTDSALQRALVAKTFLLKSFSDGESPPVQAETAPIERRALFSLRTDGTFSAFSGINRLSGNSIPGPPSSEGRFYVKDARLQFCGNVASTQLTSPDENLRLQDHVFRQVLLSSPLIVLHEGTFTASLPGKLVKTLEFSGSSN